MIRVVLADDHDLIRLGLASILDDEPDITVCGLARTGEDAVVQTRDQAPDVVILDLSMPGEGGLAAATEILAGGGAVRALVLTCHGDATHARAALTVGATGYILKDASTAQLLDAIRGVHRGELRLSPDVALALADDDRLRASSPRTRHRGDRPRWRAPWAQRPRR